MRVQGETDSFGCEYLDLCSDCYERLTKAIESQRQQPHHCDWCKKEKLGCRPHRDFEEGAGGAVYVVCPDCIRMEYARVASDYGDYDD
jgi:ribosomal protein L37AE/L43A